MTFHFSIEYQTQWGEELRVIIDGKEFSMETYDGLKWEAKIDLQPKDCIKYLYALYRNGELVWTEWEVKPHIIHLDADTTSYLINDFWRAIPDDLPLYSSAFTECVASHGKPTQQALQTFSQTLQLRLVEPRLLSHQHLAICGNTAQLGNWTQPVPLTLIALQEWGLNLDVEQIFHPIEYKFVILDDEGQIVQWEDGPNRRITSLPLSNREMWVKTDSMARFQLDNWKCAGVVVPVFSLRSEKSHGIGDFGDLKRMIHWAASAGMNAVQILPINDTTMSHTWQDSYPYNAISIYALNPIYCDLNALPPLNDRLFMETVMIKQQELNSIPEVDFEAVQHLKLDYLHKIYEQEGAMVLKTQDFKQFFEANQHWLVPYAAFCHLRDTYSTADFQTWPKYRTFHANEIRRLTSTRGKNYKQIALHYYIQYLLHLQLTEVHETARLASIILKGDIPIGISRTSVEAWSEPQYFKLNSQAGAPPDDFSVNGQNWGFPTYNWDAMLKDGCLWWERRFQQMAHYFDAYRIDHVLGFFRIWDIPEHAVHGLIGQFSPSLPMSQSEIESYGFRFDPMQMTRPYINDDLLYQLFSYRAELVKTIYLQPLANDQQTVLWAPFNPFGGSNTLYRLRPEYDTQRKIQVAFADKTAQEDIDLRDGLYRLVSNVLFIPDRQHPQLYHPRIAAQNDYAYRDLDDKQRRAFDRLYDDYYYQRHNQFWYDEAMKKLPHLTQSTRMLVCAEDLGMVPACVTWVMQQLRILSLEIQTMPKAFGVEFGNLSDNPYRSVATISTHDMPTMRQWWEEDPERAQRFYNNALQIDGSAPKQQPAWLCEEIVKRHLYSPSMLCLLSLQDWLAIDEQLRNPDVHAERINIPSNPRHYWRWRMHLTLEQLAEHTDFTEHIHTLTRQAGRQHD